MLLWQENAETFWIFSNYAKLERVFSRINHIKTDKRYSLSRDRLDVFWELVKMVPLLKNVTLMQVLIADILIKFVA